MAEAAIAPCPPLLTVSVAEVGPAETAALKEREPGLTDSMGPEADALTVSVTVILAEVAPEPDAVMTPTYVPTASEAVLNVTCTVEEELPDAVTGVPTVSQFPPVETDAVTLGVTEAPPTVVTVMNWLLALAPADAVT